MTQIKKISFFLITFATETDRNSIHTGMDKQQNRFIAVAYKLYTEKDGERELTEIASADNPFAFISGFGIALDEFEKQVEGLPTGADFNFTLAKEQAYGEFYEERVVELERSVFEIDGKFDYEHVKLNAMLPMQNEEGDQFIARVINITNENVTLDLNHPLAGKSLNFIGTIVENRDATEQEIADLIKKLSTGCEGCGGCGGKEGCNNGGCEGGCGGCD